VGSAERALPEIRFDNVSDITGAGGERKAGVEMG
jgi:hypothetical protein